MRAEKPPRACGSFMNTPLTMATVGYNVWLTSYHLFASRCPALAHTGATAEPELRRSASPGGGRAMTGSSVCAAGWVTVEVRGSLFSAAPSHSSKRRSKKGSDSEAPRQLAAAPTGFALPFTSWGPAELLCGGQRSETRCTLWHKHGARVGMCVCVCEWWWGGVGWWGITPTPWVGVSYRDAQCEVESGGWGGERWDVVQKNEHTQNKSISISELETRQPSSRETLCL